ISKAIGYQERRVELAGVDIAPDDDDPAMLHVSVEYIVIESNSRYNMVFPYYLNEAQQWDF
ncbi:MAG: hypothetical protein GY849_15840, partial [Deltaproteobacteria bacterium]|nr:hypothetical protein [Deltaproteobacteria bacterium]